jgi:hypothetical protein
MKRKERYIARLDEVSITREGDSAVIRYKEEGILTSHLKIGPGITWNIGKLEKIRAVVVQRELESPGRKVFVMAGFGDSYNTDGPFLKFIATQKLPAGKPIAVFYDSNKEPDEYRNLFYQAKHSHIVSAPRKGRRLSKEGFSNARKRNLAATEKPPEGVRVEA